MYRIHRLRETVREQFRWAAHTAGTSVVKPKDYEGGGTVEADSTYAAWMELKNTGDAIAIGDLLESESGELSIYKYIGFESAQWYVPECRPVAEPAGNTAQPTSNVGVQQHD